jgi:16S rRNA processing protein RimM
LSDFFLIAEIIDFFDVDGSVIIKSFSDFPERFFKLKKVYVDFLGKQKELTVESTKKIDDIIVLKFERFNTNEDVRFLINKKLFVDSENLYKLPENSFYIHDLIGSEVFLENMFFGKMIDILQMQNQDVYVIKKIDDTEVLIPAVEKFFENILIEERKIFLSDEAKIFYNEN